jgi:peptidyl-prolyl cis-trans isomerase SurA
VKDLPPQLAQLVLQIPLGRPSPGLKGQGGALILIVCKRDAPLLPLTPEEKAQLEAANAPPPPPPVKAEPAKMPSREEIEQEIMTERAELLSRRYLRDLRRSAFVEYRV